MLGLFGLFGRSKDLQRLDRALRAQGLHPRLMPDAAKLTTLKLLQEATGERSPAESAHEYAAALLVYCQVGDEGYAADNGKAAVEAVESRIEAALAEGDSTDARLVLLMLHAGLIREEVVARFGLEVG